MTDKKLKIEPSKTEKIDVPEKRILTEYKGSVPKMQNPPPPPPPPPKKKD
jgi:hypothetical protein